MQTSSWNQTNQTHTSNNNNSPTTSRSFSSQRMLFFLFFILTPAIYFGVLAYRHMEQYYHPVPPPPPAVVVPAIMVATTTTTSLASGSYEPLLQEQKEVEECGQREEQPQDEQEMNDYGDKDDNSQTTCAAATNTASSFCDTTNNESVVIERVHVIILVHGWLGCPQDLGYVQHAMERAAQTIIDQNKTNNEKNTEPVIVHNCVSNNGRTHDGIENGANRIANEVQQVLESVKNQYHDNNCNGGNLQEITLSIVGYSLGGIYSRYALPQILPSPTNNDKNNNTQPQLPRIVPKVFCTIATPHLGCKGHTFMHMPGLFDLMSRFTRTSRDLFRHNSLLEQTVMNRKWIQPLLQFEKRIAYANSYSMDLMVPTSTAAFLSTESPDSEHFHKQGHSEHPYMALVVETPARHDWLLLQEDEEEVCDTKKNMSHFNHTKNEDAEMARRLDAMGWTKVFVDFTDSSPSASKSFRKASSSSSLSESNKTFRAAELHSEFHPPKENQKLYLPVGHDLIAVNSKTVMSSFLFRRGRALVDQLAHDLIRDTVS